MSVPKGMVNQNASLVGRYRRAAQIAVALISPPRNVAIATPTALNK